MMGSMALHTAFTELFSLQHPIALAPMGGASGGALAAAVSNGGGLGLVGGGRQDPGWLDQQLEIVAAGTGKPWGVGFQCWSNDVATVERALAHHPRAVMLSFGDSRPFAAAIRSAGAVLIVQVTNLDEARRAVDAGADVIVAQGTEAGGHGGRRSTLPFVPVVVDLAAPTPVLAAGGIADGRGVAAALALGAAGVLLGTRFLVAFEALVTPSVTKAIIEGGGEDTERSRIRHRAGSAVAVQVSGSHPPQPILRPLEGAGRRTGGRSRCPAGLPGGRGDRHFAPGTSVGQRGDRPHHRGVPRG
jgi:nitronate monooxygenase